MQRELLRELYGELEKYHEIIAFVGLDSKTRKEITGYLKSIDVPESTVKRYQGELKGGKSKLLICDGEFVSVDKELYFQLLESINSNVKIENATGKSADVSKVLSNIKTITAKKDVQIATLKKDKEELYAVIESYKKELEELELQKQQIIDEKETMKKSVLEQPVLIISSEKILPLASDWEKQFVSVNPKEEEKPFFETESDKTQNKEMCPKNKVEGYILNKANYIRYGIQKVFSDSLMLQKIKELMEKQGKEKFIPEKPYVKKLLAEQSFSNQQKLALYAAFSEYRHTDFEKLLNFAGDNNVNADLLIQWVESLEDEHDLMQIKNALRQFAKPVEYQMKYELARELLLGIWQVEFLYKGVPSRFRLVSENDIEQVKEMLGLSNDAFTYRDYVTYEMEEKALKEKKNKETAMLKKKEMDRVQIKAPDFIKRFIIKEVDIEDYDLEEEVVDFEEMKEDEK